MKEAILNLIRDLPEGVSFAELSRIEGFKGDNHFGYPDQNLFLWFACSDLAVTALTELKDNKQIEFKPVNGLLIYSADRLIPRFPVAESIKKYSTPHWFPVTLHKGDSFPD